MFVWDKLNSTEGIMMFSRNIQGRMPKFTMCIWVYPAVNTSQFVLFSYGPQENLMIHFKNEHYFQITMQNLNM